MSFLGSCEISLGVKYSEQTKREHVWVARLRQSVPSESVESVACSSGLTDVLLHVWFFLLIYVLLKENQAELECEGERISCKTWGWETWEWEKCKGYTQDSVSTEALICCLFWNSLILMIWNFWNSFVYIIKITRLIVNEPKWVTVCDKKLIQTLVYRHIIVSYVIEEYDYIN